MQRFWTAGWACFGIVLVLGLSGCAVQTLPNGKLQIGVDNAELLGQTVASFPIVDGSEGRLRVLGGKYSVKLQKHFKVVDIEKATMVRVVSATEVAGRTLLVLEKSEPNCNVKTHLFSIKGSEVLSWDFGDCRVQPVTAIDSDQAVFDFAQDRQTTRFTYRDARLMRGNFANANANATANSPTSPKPSAVDAKGPRYSPGPPVAWVGRPAANASSGTTGASSAPSPAASPKATAKPAAAPATTVANASNAQRPAAPQSAKAMDFPMQEQKPVRIVLDN